MRHTGIAFRNVTSFSRFQSEIRQIEKGAHDRRLTERNMKGASVGKKEGRTTDNRLHCEFS